MSSMWLGKESSSYFRWRRGTTQAESHSLFAICFVFGKRVEGMKRENFLDNPEWIDAHPEAGYEETHGRN